MATENKVHATVDDDADDEDLEALRLAALQTLRVNKPPIAVGTNKVQLHHRAMGSTGARGLYRGGISRARPGRNNVFQRHRVNSNLIAIVPVSEDSTVGNSVTENKIAGRSAYSDSPTKLILPQDRYCKTGSSQITNEEHAVTSKFTRYEDYNSNSSAEESDEGEGTSIAKNVVATVEEPENDPDVLVMGAEDEDSLEKLMDELEEEINRSETDVPVNNSKKKSLHKNVVNKVNLSSENTEKLEKGAVKLSKNKHVSTISEKSKSKVPVKTKLSTSKNKVLHSVSPFHHKSVNTSENSSYHKQSSKLCKEPTLVRESPSRHVSKDISPKRHFSPVNNKCSRSGTRSPLLLKRSRSRSPRTRYYSPPSRLPPSPRGQFSRSPIRSPRRSRSRSPARSYISSKEKCSRSPPWYPPANHHLGRLSPRRSLSPHARRDFSPRRSLSPRSNNTSSIRSPGQSRWPPSPRRSPLHPHRSVSPAFSRRPHSKSKRISPSPPRRPVSSQRRRLSPSPIRRNPSPPHKYSPLRRNPSPPRSRYSRSLSRSPLARSRSPPISRPLHPVSPPPISPRRRLSGSPRQHTSHSPYNRLPPKRLSPAARKSSPWSPLRQASSRYSSPPAPKQRSSSPFSRQRQRSNSADREVHRNRPPKRISHSPTRDSRKPLQESRMTNTSARSRSPPAVARIIPNPRSRHGTRSPRHSVSPPKRSMSRSSSLSLSPSPERTAVNDSHRYKSPLRVTDYRSVPVSAPKESKNALHHGLREVKGTKLRNHLSPLPTTAKVCTKTKSSKRKEFRAKLPQRSNKEEIKTDSINLSQDKSHSASTEKYTTDAACAKQNSEVNPEVLSVLEARRRKFETVEPVKPTAKKICLKAVRSEQREENDQQQPARVKEETLKSSDSESRLLEGSEDDFCDLDDHEPFPELDFLSSDESDIDQESRFKSSDQNTVTGDGMMGSMQFSKILAQPSTHEDKMVQHKKMLDGAKAKDLREKEIVDKTHTKQRKNSEDPWGKDKVGILAQGNKQSKAAGSDDQVNLEEVHDKVEAIKSSKDGDLRTELSRRRAERLTKAGSLHEKLPARLVQSAFEGVMGKKNTKHVEREEKHLSSKQAESKKEKSDVRRVLVLKRPVVERRVASISVTIPKESKRDCSPPPAKLPIRMRLGLPSIGTGSSPEEHLSSRRRNRKMKLKRNVMLGNNKV